MAQAVGHADRIVPFKAYCTGLLLPGERKSIEPMAARLDPDHVGRMHQSLHHLIAEAPWEHEILLDRALDTVLPAMLQQAPIVAWVADDTEFLKKGQHSVGVTRQYCRHVGKEDNCQVAVTLSLTTEEASMPIAFQLYLPEVWAEDEQRRKKAGVPKEVGFQTKPEIALGQIERARQRGLPRGVVLAHAGYGNDTQFRNRLTEGDLLYFAGIQSVVKVWKPGEQPRPARPSKGLSRPPKLFQRDSGQLSLTVKELALALRADAWKNISWREGVAQKPKSRFAAVRVCPAHRDYGRAEPHAEEWLLIEWPKDESEPTKYWLSTLPADTSLAELVYFAKHRWIIERDYQELKHELGLGHFEGRGWRGFHHHATLCIAAYGFLVSERSRFSPSTRAGHLKLSLPKLPNWFRPRGSPRARRAT
ncbi:MAG: IS701 family transposase [Bryobacteraceae bacterium]